RERQDVAAKAATANTLGSHAPTLDWYFSDFEMVYTTSTGASTRGGDGAALWPSHAAATLAWSAQDAT
ncbi:hypothetical protein, partial [Xanthomonas sacchari]|uniref:hypothetical protein n=1 Tax=Xanthomonas sacchari TaxID=56458 RepID=UPI002259CAFA